MFFKIKFTPIETLPAISQGNEKAFEALFREQYAPLCRFALRFTGDHDEAEELVQEVFYQLWENRMKINISITPAGYLFRSVQNRYLNKVKHLKVRQSYADHQNSRNDHAAPADSEVRSKELEKQINSAMDSLPEQCGKVFRLSRNEGLKYSEIAKELGISEKTVENHMGKALRLLRENLREYLPLLLIILYTNRG